MNLTRLSWYQQRHITYDLYNTHGSGVSSVNLRMLEVMASALSGYWRMAVSPENDSTDDAHWKIYIRRRDPVWHCSAHFWWRHYRVQGEIDFRAYLKDVVNTDKVDQTYLTAFATVVLNQTATVHRSMRLPRYPSLQAEETIELIRLLHSTRLPSGPIDVLGHTQSCR
jgi:hypothetical protein